MSLKRQVYRCLRICLSNWQVVVLFGFILTLFVIRLALYAPPKRTIYHSGDEDYQDVPRHHVPHHPKPGNQFDDDSDFGQPVTIRSTSTEEPPRTPAGPRRVFVSSGQIYENKSVLPTTPFLIDGNDWRLGAWEYFVHFYNNSKLILFWTPWYDDDTWKIHVRRNGEQPVIRLGTPDAKGVYADSRSCYMGFDRSKLSEATVVVFHGGGMSYELDNLPEKHYDNQYWTYYDIDPPVTSPLGKDLKEWRNKKLNAIGFNWTWSYSHLANVPHPYGRIYKKENAVDVKDMNERVRKNLANWQNREFDALMISANCYTKSNREVLVSQLIKEYGVKIETLGRCHNAYSPELLLDQLGPDGMYSRYRFYFAFENCLCDDFMTEKVFRAYNASKYHSVIPVLYGAGKTYSYFLPEGSYINAENFGSAKELADYLKKMASVPVSTLERFFAWQKDYDIEMRFIRNGLRRMCEKIWEVTGDAKLPKKLDIVEDIAATFGNCRTPSRKWLGLLDDVEVMETTLTVGNNTVASKIKEDNEAVKSVVGSSDLR